MGVRHSQVNGVSGKPEGRVADTHLTRPHILLCRRAESGELVSPATTAGGSSSRGGRSSSSKSFRLGEFQLKQLRNGDLYKVGAGLHAVPLPCT